MPAGVWTLHWRRRGPYAGPPGAVLRATVASPAVVAAVLAARAGAGVRTAASGAEPQTLRGAVVLAAPVAGAEVLPGARAGATVLAARAGAEVLGG